MAEEGHAREPYLGLPPGFAKLFIARQKDLQVSRNIELQLARFTQLILEQTYNKLVLRE